MSSVRLPPIAGGAQTQEGSSARPSGRRNVKSSFIGLTNTGGAGSSRVVARREALGSAFASYLAGGGGGAAAAFNTNPPARRARDPTAPATTVATPAIAATPAHVPSGAMSARAGRRSLAASGAASPALSHTARNPSRRRSAAAAGDDPFALPPPATNASLIPPAESLAMPEWLNSPYPRPQPPKDAMIDALLAPATQPTTALENNTPKSEHAHDQSCTHTPGHVSAGAAAAAAFSYYRPLSPPKRHLCDSPRSSRHRSYMYAHRTARATSSSRTRGVGVGSSVVPNVVGGGVGGVGSSGLGGGPSGLVAPEAWSSWPFVNPRLFREEDSTHRTAAHATNTSSARDTNEEKSDAPTVPGVPRLFSSVVTEHERTLVFEYIRSTYSQLFAWPPPPPIAHDVDDDQKDAPVLLPTVVFTDAHLDRLLEESRTSAACIDLLRRLDAELTLQMRRDAERAAGEEQTSSETAGNSKTQADPDSDEEPLPARGAPRVLESPEELITAVTEARLYLAALRRRIYRWFVRPRARVARDAAAAAATADAEEGSTPAVARPLALFRSSTGTVFVTPALVDSLCALASSGGLAEEEVASLLKKMDSEASSDARLSCTTWTDLESRVRDEATRRLRQALAPNEPSLSSSSTLALASTGANGHATPPPDEELMNESATQPFGHGGETSSSAVASTEQAAAALQRHVTHARAHARLLVFQFLRDEAAAADSAAAATDAVTGAASLGSSSNTNTTPSLGLFARGREVAATVSEMDELLDATAGLTLGTSYETVAWGDHHSSSPAADTAANSRAPSVVQVSSGPRASSRSRTPDGSGGEGSSSRGRTRPVSPVEPASSSSTSTEAPPSLVTSPLSTASAAVSARAYGAFLASRTVRVLRSLVFHGLGGLSKFDDLVQTADKHTRRLRAERVKVWTFLTGRPFTAEDVAASATAAAAAHLDSHVSAEQDPTSNAARGVGLFDAYYAETERRERARADAEAARVAQVRQNTHQFGTAHHLHGHHGAAVAGADKSHAHPPARAASGGSTARARSQRASLHKGSAVPVPRASGRRRSEAVATAPTPAASPPPAATPSGVPSHVIPVAAPAPSPKDPRQFFDWGLSAPQPPPPEPISMSFASNSSGGGGGSSRSIISRYASAKTLPPTTSRSALLRHESPLTSGVAETTAPLPPLRITPEHVDALFGSFAHLLSPASLSSSLDVASSSGSPSPAFDPLLEQDDEDYLLESEAEEAYNSMDLAMLLRAYKTEIRDNEAAFTANNASGGGANGAEEPDALGLALRRRHTPSYLAAHPLFRPMLEQLAEERASGATTNGKDADEELHTSASTISRASSSSQQQQSTDDTPLEPVASSTSTVVPTLQSLLAPASPSAAADQQPSTTSEEETSSAAPIDAEVQSAENASETVQPQALDATPATVDAVASADEGAAESAQAGAPDAVSAVHSTPTASSVDGADTVSLPVADSPSESAVPASESSESVDPSSSPAPSSEVAAEVESTSTPGPDTSRDVIIRDPNADFERWRALSLPSAPDSRPQTSEGGPEAQAASVTSSLDVASAPVPKMLPVVWQLLREAGKMKLHSGALSNTGGAASSSSTVASPAGAGTVGLGLAAFVPHSGAVVPGGSLGSMKTIAILRELSRAGRAFYGAPALVRAVCSVRAERKWQRRVQAHEKRKLIAAGVTIATPSGLPNDDMPRATRRRHTRDEGHAQRGAHAAPISAAQFAILSTSGMSRVARRFQVVDESASSGTDAAPTGVDSAESTSLSVSASESFLAPSAFPSTLESPAYPGPPAVKAASGVRRRNARGEIIVEPNPRDDEFALLLATPNRDDDDGRSRAWARARLLTHLSELLLFEGAPTDTSAPNTNAETNAGATEDNEATNSDANAISSAPSPVPAATPSSLSAPAPHEVEVRMSDVESLLDALSDGPSEAAQLSERVAREEREALERLVAADATSAEGERASAVLRSLPPLSHPLAPLLAVLTWLDAQEAVFTTVNDLVRAIATGEWAAAYRERERAQLRRQRGGGGARATESETELADEGEDDEETDDAQE